MREPNIIGTGSSGNATIIDGILLDCGMPMKQIKPYIKEIKLVLLTHIHSDHFNGATIKAIHSLRPTVRFACGSHLAVALKALNVSPLVIDIMSPGQTYSYGPVDIEPVELVHNVPNYGYKIRFSDGVSLIYATDTSSLNGIEAKNYNYYLIEANHTEQDIHDRIKQKELEGIYAYEYQAAQNHLSREKADEWIYKNSGPSSLIYYMHEHISQHNEVNNG